jgi:hypothetical protein
MLLVKKVIGLSMILVTIPLCQAAAWRPSVNLKNIKRQKT